MIRSVVIAGFLLVFTLTAAGCDYIGFYTRRQHWKVVFENQPRMSRLMRVAPEDSLLLDGRIVQLHPRREPLLLAAVSSQYKKDEIVALRTLRLPADNYSALLPQGSYDLYVYADADQNGWFERDELIGRTPPGEPVEVLPKLVREGFIVDGPTITVDFDHPVKTELRVRVKVRATSYIYSSLDDNFFDPKFGTAGLYNPAGFMAHTQGFIFGLDEIDEKKTMVLFVHGISGTPREWTYFVDGLDRDRFQPFFFYYPSGLPLDMLGAVLAEVIDTVDKSSNSQLHRIVIAAHSLGGLVSLSAIQKLASEGLPPSLALFVSFSSPYGGDDTADTWVDRMPVVVPSWRDVATGSEFLSSLASKPFPRTLPFYLFFTYKDPSTFKLGESSDGVVALRSQLEPRIQAMTTKIRGFNSSHGDFLRSEQARQAFLQLLDTVTPPKVGKNVIHAR